MHVEDFILRTDTNGIENVEFVEDPTKTRQGGLKPNYRKTNPKMFAIGGVKCPVRLFKWYLSKRPDKMKDTGRFYLSAKKSFNLNDDV